METAPPQKAARRPWAPERQDPGRVPRRYRVLDPAIPVQRGILATETSCPFASVSPIISTISGGRGNDGNAAASSSSARGRDIRRNCWPAPPRRKEQGSEKVPGDRRACWASSAAVSIRFCGGKGGASPIKRLRVQLAYDPAAARDPRRQLDHSSSAHSFRASAVSETEQAHTRAWRPSQAPAHAATSAARRGGVTPESRPRTWRQNCSPGASSVVGCCLEGLSKH